MYAMGNMKIKGLVFSFLTGSHCAAGTGTLRDPPASQKLGLKVCATTPNSRLSFFEKYGGSIFKVGSLEKKKILGFYE